MSVGRSLGLASRCWLLIQATFLAKFGSGRITRPWSGGSSGLRGTAEGGTRTQDGGRKTRSFETDLWLACSRIDFQLFALVEPLNGGFPSLFCAKGVKISPCSASPSIACPRLCLGFADDFLHLPFEYLLVPLAVSISSFSTPWFNVQADGKLHARTYVPVQRILADDRGVGTS